MNSKKLFAALCLCVVAFAGGSEAFAAGKTCPANGKLKVFILAGQSNMVGFGQVKGDSPGTMESYLKSNPKAYGKLVDAAGKPVVRDDVWIVNLSYKGKEQQGWLTVGYGGSEGHIGPEYGFGFEVGNYYEDPVLLIKCAWGGRSLSHNFLPPSSEKYPTPQKDGDKGYQYAETVRIVKEVTGNLKKYYPSYTGKGYEIVGFGWHQGWNDRINQKAVDVYEQNLVNFIKDMRKDLGVPGLPFVIANTGMGGWDIPAKARTRRRLRSSWRPSLPSAIPPSIRNSRARSPAWRRAASSASARSRPPARTITGSATGRRCT